MNPSDSTRPQPADAPTAEPTPRILVIDDNPAIHEDFRKILCAPDTRLGALDSLAARLFDETATKEATASFEVDSAYQGQEGLELAKRALAEGRPYALAFVDVRMPPGWDGVETIEHLWQHDGDLQVVVCTAYSDYSWEQMAARFGSPDSLLILKKPFDTIEVLQLAHALTRKWTLNRQARCRMDDLERLVTARTIELSRANENLRQENTERKHAEAALRRSEERFAKAFRASPLALAILRLGDLRVVDVNDQFCTLAGTNREGVLGLTAAELRPALTPGWDEVARQLQEEISLRNLAASVGGHGSDARSLLVSAELISLDNAPHALLLVQDVSDRLRLEEHLRRAQKMEAVGQLAAGVAHDFNNILTVIQGYVQMQLDGAQLEVQTRECLQEVLRAALRAAALTRQLLAFSRQQAIQPQPLDLNEVVHDMHRMLSRTLGEQIELHYALAPDLPPALADRSSVEQILLNLAVNARDAMAAGGHLRIQTSLRVVNPEDQRHNREAVLGPNLCLSVTDTGCGMDAAIRSRIFEPFFTTKEVGKGTGLGLATVFGLVKQHRGWLEVDSEVGTGSTFRVYLPPSQEHPRKSGETADPELAPTLGQPCVLLVEDEDSLRDLAQRVLENGGYRVIAAPNGQEALKLWQDHQDQIDVLLTDLVMPGFVSGRELAERLRLVHPGLKVIYSSGYSVELIETDLKLEPGVNYLPKPYPPSKLLGTVAQMLKRTAA